jgi:hypothetical protein
MKTVFLLLFAAVCLLLTVTPAASQGYFPIKVTVDTDFRVGNITLPAGEYRFTFDTPNSRMYITNVNTTERLSVFTLDVIDSSVPTENKLVFLQDEKGRTLHRVWSEQAGHVHDIVHGTEVAELM